MKELNFQLRTKKKGRVITVQLIFIIKSLSFQSFDGANGENTVLFVKYLQHLHKGKKLLLIWDQASYHHCSEMQVYLKEINKGLEENDWIITCILFESNAPDQNPVEDIWLKGKDFLRKHFYDNKTFQQTKKSFLIFSINKFSILRN